MDSSVRHASIDPSVSIKPSGISGKTSDHARVDRARHNATEMRKNMRVKSNESRNDSLTNIQKDSRY